jgi:hypothetical protein
MQRKESTMERTKANLTIGAIAISVAATFLLAPAGRAQDAGTTPPPATTTAPPPATTTAPPADPAAQAKVAVETQANANAQANAEVLANVRKTGATADAKARDKFDADVTLAAKQVEADAVAAGDVKIAERLGTEFGMTPDALVAERNELGTSWGQLMIAHTLMANSTAELTARQVFDLRTEGMGWGQIAHGMGLKLGPAVSAVKTEARVARGLEKADGKVSSIQGPGSRAGADAAAKAAAKASIKANAAGTQAKVGAGAGVGTGAGVGVGGGKVDK